MNPQLPLAAIVSQLNAAIAGQNAHLAQSLPFGPSSGHLVMDGTFLQAVMGVRPDNATTGMVFRIGLQDTGKIGHTFQDNSDRTIMDNVNGITLFDIAGNTIASKNGITVRTAGGVDILLNSGGLQNSDGNVIAGRALTAGPAKGFKFFKDSSTQVQFPFLINRSGAFTGSGPPALGTGPWQLAWGTSVQSTDAGGNAGVSLSPAFSNGIIAVVAVNGDGGVPGGTAQWVCSSTTSVSTSQFNFHATKLDESAGTVSAFANTSVRLNWAALGW